MFKLKQIPIPIAIIIGALIIGLSFFITNQINNYQIKKNCGNVLGSHDDKRTISFCYLNIKAGKSPF